VCKAFYVCIKQGDFMRKLLAKLGFLCSGTVNGLLGSGGGLLSLALLRKQAERQATSGQDGAQNAPASPQLVRRIQATSLAVVWPMCAVSSVVYAANGLADWPVTGWVCLGMTTGAVVGIFLLKKMQSKLIDGGLALLMVYTGARMLLG